jgi:urease accessory protein
VSQAFENSFSVEIASLQLLHLADSALPIGAMAHSFGLESLVVEAGLREADLLAFFSEWLAGTGRLEAAFCMWAHAGKCEEDWRRLNLQMSSFKVSRESREASLRLGRRFLALAAMMTRTLDLDCGGDAHLSAAFGRVSGALGMSANAAAAACLHQALYGAISCCQRLMPFGQSAAMRLLWTLKPVMLEAVNTAADSKREELWNVQPILEIASMRHPQLSTRLFIS